VIDSTMKAPASDSNYSERGLCKMFEFEANLLSEPTFFRVSCFDWREAAVFRCSVVAVSRYRANH